MMELTLRKTRIQNLDFIFSNCPNRGKEDLSISYQFVKELFCRVCKRSLLFGNNKYGIVDYPFLYRERQLDSVVLPVIKKDVKHFEEQTKGLIRLGLHFITPYCDRERNMKDVDGFENRQIVILKRLYKDVSRAKPKTTTPDFMASWILPRNEELFDVPYKGTYPGLLLLGKMYPSIQHDGCI